MVMRTSRIYTYLPIYRYVLSALVLGSERRIADFEYYLCGKAVVRFYAMCA